MVAARCLGVGDDAAEATVLWISAVGTGAVATEPAALADGAGVADNVAAVLACAISLATGSGAAALGRTPWGPNEMTQSPKMKSPAKTDTPA